MNVGVVSCLFVIRGSFAQSWSVWEHEACPSSVRNQEGPVRLWEVVSVFLDSDFNPCHSYSVLYRGCPLVVGSVMGGSTVHCLHKYTHCFVLNYLCFRVPFRLARELK